MMNHRPMVQMDLCQRWRDGRASYRPAGEVFDPRHASVEPVDDATAKAFVQRHHYSRTYPAARFRAGVYVKDPFGKSRLCGVGVYSVPMNQRVIPSYFAGVRPEDGVELGRFVLADELAANAETWALARMHRLLRRALPSVRGVLAYSDPIERRDIYGAVVKRGHVGTIYRAGNADFRGRSAGRTQWLTPDGFTLCDRTLSKVRLDEVGAGYVLDRLQVLNAPARATGEDGRAYLARLRDCGWLRGQRHPGNFAFTWSF